MRAILLSIVGLFGLLAGPAGPIAAEEGSAKHWRGMAVFGVDVMGRFAIALDSNKDGKLDRFWLFVAEEYLPGPWFETSQVEILEKNRSLTLRTRDERHVESYFVGVSVGDTQPINAPASVTHSHVHESGVQLLGVAGVERRLDLFDPMDLAAWPPGFKADDVLNPGTTGTPCTPIHAWYYSQGCDSGGKGQRSCSVGGCSIAPTSCSASRTQACFACCTCVEFGDPVETSARCKCFGDV